MALSRIQAFAPAPLPRAGAYDAQDTATKYAPELGMQTVPSLNITYTEVRRAPYASFAAVHPCCTIPCRSIA